MKGPLSYRAVLYDALASGATMAVIGLLGMAAGQPWLFPSLGPTIFLQAGRPDDRPS